MFGKGRLGTRRVLTIFSTNDPCFFPSFLQRNGLFIEWNHIRDLYNKLSTMATHSKGLSLVPKLKFEHVNLTSCSKMRVDLAAQVHGIISVVSM